MRKRKSRTCDKDWTGDVEGGGEEQLTDVGSKIYSTQENGALIVEVEDGGTMKVGKWKRMGTGRFLWKYGRLVAIMYLEI